MYVYRDLNGVAVFSSDAPQVEVYWEIENVPTGNGICMITEDGEIYYIKNGHPLNNTVEDTPSSLDNILISALID